MKILGILITYKTMEKARNPEKLRVEKAKQKRVENKNRNSKGK